MTFAQHQSYKVRRGETVSDIASKLGVSKRALMEANDLSAHQRLHAGRRLVVPHIAHHRKIANVAGGYVIRKGDCDWTIAHKFDISVPKLHELNPGVRWTALQLGHHLRVPGSSSGRSSSASVAIHARHIVIDGDNVTLRRKPSTEAEAVTTVDAGTHAIVIDRVKGWYKLKFPKGTVAWVDGDYVHASKSQVVASHRSRRSHSSVAYHRRRRHGHTAEVALDLSGVENPVLRKAAALRGVRYRYGGTSRAGFDCSGMVQNVYRGVGVKLPRSSREMYQVGKHVAKADLKAGDLVFFHTGGHHGGVTHVGIATGHGKFIHASSGGGKVQVNSLNDSYYSRHFSGARRVAKFGTAKKSTSADNK